MSDHWMLEVLSGPRQGTKAALSSRPVRIGRAETNEVCVPDKAASRQHAEVVVTEQGVVLTDLGARNPTLVNGRVVTGSVKVQPGDKIEIGNTRFGLLPGATAAGGATPAVVVTPKAAPVAAAPQPTVAVRTANGRAPEAEASASSPAVRYFFFGTLLLAGLYYLVLAPALNTGGTGDVQQNSAQASPNAWDADAAAAAVTRLGREAPATPGSAELGMFYYAVGRNGDAAEVWARSALGSPEAQKRAERAETRWRLDWEAHREAGLTDATLGNVEGAQRHLGIALRMARAHGNTDEARELEQVLRGLGVSEEDRP